MNMVTIVQRYFVNCWTVS